MKEIIEHNNKKIVKTTKQNGDVSYSIKGVYIGTDVKTGKRITKSITARTLKALDRKIVEAKIQFEKYGSTVKETIQIESEVILTPTSFPTLESINLTRLNLLIFNFGLTI